MNSTPNCVPPARGCAIDHEDNEEGVRSVAAAIRDAPGRPVAAISVSGPFFRVTNEKVPIVARSVTAAAADQSTQLGFDIQEVQAEQAGGAQGQFIPASAGSFAVAP